MFCFIFTGETTEKVLLIFSFGSAGVPYLQHPAHPLEAVLLRGVGPLLGHHHDALVSQHRHGEHGDPAETENRNTAGAALITPGLKHRVRGQDRPPGVTDISSG